MGHHKFNAKPQRTEDGYFHSTGEMQRWNILKLLESNGEIRDLKRQVKYELQPPFKVDGEKIGAISFTIDFQYYEGDQLVVEDFKGAKTRDFLMRMKMFRYKYPHIAFRVTGSRS